MKTICVPIKELYWNPLTNYRIISCVPSYTERGITVNKYGNFTLCGDNLKFLQLDNRSIFCRRLIALRRRFSTALPNIINKQFYIYFTLKFNIFKLKLKYKVTFNLFFTNFFSLIQSSVGFFI